MYLFVEHTGELELQIEAPNEQEVFTEAMAAYSELLRDHSLEVKGAEVDSFPVSASAPDHPTLLAEWLNELIYLAETQNLIPQQVVDLKIQENALEATVTGVKGEPSHLVKAVTYHRLTFNCSDKGCTATLVFDV